jgi:3-oxoacyl-[acyl-carrier-protein] synthase II
MNRQVGVTGLAVMSCLGNTPAEHQDAMACGAHRLCPLGEILGVESRFARMPGGWIRPRSGLAGRRYGPATNLAVALARQAAADAKLSPEVLRDAWLFVGSSRGNAAGWLAPWPGRRPVAKMATSNSMHSEMAAAISIDLGIRGPYNVLSNGCSSGLDALGFGFMAVSSGLAPRALVVAADLPLLDELLTPFAQTGLLSQNGVNDPYSPDTSGFLPAEGGAALVLEPIFDQSAAPANAYGELLGYWANSDAYDALGLPPDGKGIADCIRIALENLRIQPREIAAVCPHASGTLAHGQAELCALKSLFFDSEKPGVAAAPSLHLMKPFTGHALGASGAMDAAILFHHLRERLLPPNLPALAGGELFKLPAEPRAIGSNAIVLKIAAGMGGHNAIVTMCPMRSNE